MRDLSKIKDKLRKLLNLSGDVSASEGEIDNAMSAATRIMAQHNLTRDDIDMKSDDPVANVRMGRHATTSIGGNLSTWESMLAHFVVRFIGYVSWYKTGTQMLKKNGLAVLDEQGNQRKGCLVYFYGSDDSCDAAIEIYEELRDTISAMAQLLHGSWYRGDGALYAQGFCQGLKDAHLRSVQALKDGDHETTALVLRDEKNQLAVQRKSTNWLKKEHGVRLSSGGRRSGASGDPNAYRQGRADGKNYNPSRPSGTRKIA